MAVVMYSALQSINNSLMQINFSSKYLLPWLQWHSE